MAGTLRDGLLADWTKLRTVSSNAWLLLGSIAVTVGLGALTTSIDKCQAGCTADPAKLSLTGVQLGQAIIVIVAVLAVSGEYSSGMIRLTLTATPRRSAMMAAKSAVISVVAAVVSAVAVLGSLLTGQLLLPRPLTITNTRRRRSHHDVRGSRQRFRAAWCRSERRPAPNLLPIHRRNRRVMVMRTEHGS